MKKLVLALAVAFGASMVACSSSNNDANAEGQAVEETVVEEVAEVVTPDSVDSVAPAAADSVAPAAADSVK